jgi:hypothetical protein
MTKRRFIVIVAMLGVIFMALLGLIYLASIGYAQTPGQVYNGGSCFTDPCRHPFGLWTTPYMIAYRTEEVNCLLGQDGQCVTGKANLTFSIMICPAGEFRECLWSVWEE